MDNKGGSHNYKLYCTNSWTASIDVLVVVNGDPLKMQRMISEIVINILLNKEEYISAKTLSVVEYEFQKRLIRDFLEVLERRAS